jgi:Secreted and surface protein containing fasciclin-like repeats
MRSFLTVLALAATAALPSASQAQHTKMVGGAAMYPTKDIIDNAVNSKDHTTLVAAVKAAGLVETLKGPGPFTVFAPTECGVCEAAGRYGGQPAQAGAQGGTDGHPHVPRRFG